MKIFIHQINDIIFSPCLIVDSIVKTVKFESNYMKKTDSYIVKYKIEGLNDIFESEVLI